MLVLELHKVEAVTCSVALKFVIGDHVPSFSSSSIYEHIQQTPLLDSTCSSPRTIPTGIGQTESFMI